MAKTLSTLTHSDAPPFMPDTLAPITTIGELMEFYLQYHVSRLRLRSAQGTERRMRRYLSQFAALPLAGLTRRRIVQWAHEIGETRGRTAANQALQDVHAMFVKAERLDIYDGKNPAHGVKKYKKVSRSRFVQPIELLYLRKALAEEKPNVEVYFLTLMLTGARRDEARTVLWKDLDLVNATWHKSSTKTGLHTVPLPTLLLERIKALPQICDYVFPSEPNIKNHYTPGVWCGTAVEYHWRRIRTRAGLPDVTIHDLRRSCASWLAESGENLAVISAVLNHSSLASTQVYARLSVRPVRKALNEQAERLFGQSLAVPTSSVLTSASPGPAPVLASASLSPAAARPESMAMEWPG